MAAHVTIGFLFGYSKAKIVTNSHLWTGKDWYDPTSKIGVSNGVPYSGDADVERFIEAPLALEGEVPDYLEYDNV
jgi:hypothetical protein